MKTRLRLFAAALGAAAATQVAAQEVTLKVAYFLPASSFANTLFITPWCERIAKESNNKMKCQMYPSMQLGGTPPQLFDQAKDGVADITWTVLGYTPGRFVKTEVFEIPFIAPSGPNAGEITSKAVWEYVDKYAGDEFKDVKLIAVHAHGPGVFHTKQAVTGLETLRGMKIRGGTRIVNNMLVKLGATPVGMPVPAVTEALSKGVIDGATTTWEVSPSLKVTELVKNHTSFAGDKGLYNMAFAFSMNKATYDKLPPDLKKVIDNNSGLEAAAMFGRAMDEGDKAGRDIAAKAGNNLVTLDAAETQRWLRTASSVESDWVTEVAKKGIDGKKLASEARALIDKYNR